MRKLIEDKPSVVARYNEKAKELIISHEINRKLDTLEDKWDDFDDMQRRVKLDIIDKLVTSLLLYAEKKYRKIRTGEVDFSLEVNKAVEVWYF